jgi:hypothetical protein
VSDSSQLGPSHPEPTPALVARINLGSEQGELGADFTFLARSRCPWRRKLHLVIIEHIGRHPNCFSGAVPPRQVLYRDQRSFQSRSTSHEPDLPQKKCWSPYGVPSSPFFPRGNAVPYVSLGRNLQGQYHFLLLRLSYSLVTPRITVRYRTRALAIVAISHIADMR